MSVRPPVNVFRRSWLLLLRNPALIVPGIVAAGLSAFFAIVFEPSATTVVESNAQLASDLITRTLAFIGQIFSTILAIAFTTGMAGAAWASDDGRCSFKDGARAFWREGGHVLVALLALLGLGLVAAVLSPFTLSLSIALYAFLCIYTMASAVVGERNGLAAVAESAEIAYTRPWITLAIVGAILGIALLMGVIAELASDVPYVGSIVSALVVQYVIAYAMLVIVGEYRIVRRLEAVPVLEAKP